MPIPDRGKNARQGISRRSLSRFHGDDQIGATMIDAASALMGQAEAAETGGPPVAGPEPVPITLKVNGVPHGRCRLSRG